MKVKILKRVPIDSVSYGPDAGTILVDRIFYFGFFDSKFQCTEGQYIGAMFDGHAFQPLPEDPRENPIKEAEDVIRRRDQQICQMQVNIDRLIGNVALLEKERQELADKLLANKVSLPREVAEALDWQFKVNGNDWPGVVADAFMSSIDKRKQCITDYAADNYPDFLRALVNGYTVEETVNEAEQTPEDKMRPRFKGCLERYEVNFPVGIDTMVEMLLFEAREVLAEERQAQL